MIHATTTPRYGRVFRLLDAAAAERREARLHVALQRELARLARHRRRRAAELPSCASAAVSCAAANIGGDHHPPAGKADVSCKL